MLARAANAASAAGVNVDWIHADATRFILSMWGGTAGNWGRRDLDLDEIEIMIVARKIAEPSAAGGVEQRA